MSCMIFTVFTERGHRQETERDCDGSDWSMVVAMVLASAKSCYAIGRR